VLPDGPVSPHAASNAPTSASTIPSRVIPAPA
jgi:hypothetical protein